jgi:aspartate aminotransferase-like enzyme
MNLELFSERPAAGMTAVRIPAGVDAGRLLSGIEQRFGVKLASGQLELKGKIFRIAHFGLLDELDIIATLAAIELVLDELGHPATLGAAAAAAGRALREAESAHQTTIA